MNVYVSGQKVSYLKRVPHGAPYIVFAKEGEYVRPYTESQAKGWARTLQSFGFEVEVRNAN